MRTPQPGEWRHDAMAVLAAMGVAFLAIVLVFLRLDASGQSVDRWPDAAPSGRSPGPEADVARPNLAEYRSEALDLRLRMPSGWTLEDSAGAALGPMFRDQPPDRGFAAVAPDGETQLVVGEWDTGKRAAFNLWVGVVAGALAPVDDIPLPNAVVAGRPAAVVWQPSAEGSGGRPEAAADGGVTYVALVDREATYLAVLCRSFDAAVARHIFESAVASLQWPGSGTTTHIPSLPGG